MNNRRWSGPCRMLGAGMLGIALCAGCGGDDAADSAALPKNSETDERCPEDTPEFAATPTSGTTANGKRGLVQARLIAAKPAQPERFENDWTVRFTDPSGGALAGLQIIDACAFMPVHGHGAAPGGVREVEAGTYALDGLNLFMRGPWEVQLAVSFSGAQGALGDATSCDREGKRPGRDMVTFRACVVDD